MSMTEANARGGTMHEIAPVDAPKLTTRQEQFINAYLEIGEATGAARAVGLSPDYGRQLMYDPAYSHVKEEIERRKEALCARAQVSTEKILVDLKKLAHADFSKAYSETWDLLPLSQIPEEVRFCIQEVVPLKGGKFKVRWADRQRALEMLGKYKNLWVEKGESAGFTLIVNNANVNGAVDQGPMRPVDMGEFSIDVPVAPTPLAPPQR
jgi:hypothetical protein